ncbi:MAG: hypothetical protein EA362_01785 [Saprospirales bacterium]|nr:MAG: hypothetical protein EA362_01785 [Saprospirales bacterium]
MIKDLISHYQLIPIKAFVFYGLKIGMLCFFSSNLFAQVVFEDKEGDLFIQLPDGTMRNVAPSDSILYRPAFDNILPLPDTKEEDKDSDIVPGKKIEGAVYDMRQVSISVNIRHKENRIRFLQNRILVLESKIEELNESLEFARANPSRIRPNERIELSDNYNSAVEEKASAKREVPRLKKELVVMKRQNHLDILALLSLPGVPLISEDYFMNNFDIKPPILKTKEISGTEEKKVIWEAPTDIPMPIIPHPSSVEIRDVIKNPPSRICRLVQTKSNIFDSSFLLRTESEHLTFHLPAEMRVHRRGRPMLSIDSHFEVREGGKFMVLDIILQIPSARRSMGGIRKNRPIRIEMLNGEIVNLQIINEDTGTFFQDLNEVHFRAVAPLSRKDYQILAENEIDRLRIQWDSGYQDYEVFDIKVLQHQINCINQSLSKK